MPIISKIIAREILASNGQPTIETEVQLDNGIKTIASVAYGASAGKHEAVMLPADIAVNNVNTILAPAIVGMDVFSQIAIDQKMITLDITDNKSHLGGNAILSVSMAIARVAALAQTIPLYKYLQNTFQLSPTSVLPKPMIVMIEGGKHADNTTDLQEYLVSCLGTKSVKEMLDIEIKIYQELKKILDQENLSTNVGNEGAFAPDGIADNEKPLQLLTQAITTAGFVLGQDVGLSLDAAASEFFDQNSKTYTLKTENKQLNSLQLIEYYSNWLSKYQFISWEDMLSEDDKDNWRILMGKVGDKVRIIADDLTVTNRTLLEATAQNKMANAIIIKPNQAGTVTETIQCCQKANELGFWTITSHRGGGETDDTFIADLAVAVGSLYLKCGITRGERVAKYNRLLEIESELTS